jgi:hypothetical protein
MNFAHEMNWEMYPGMIQMETIGDGSCFFHAIAYSMYELYKKSSQIERRKIVRSIRNELADKLSVTQDNGKTVYQNLSRGKLEEFSLCVPEYSLNSMINILKSDRSVDNIFNELVSNILNVDIYLLDGKTKDVYITGNDDDILYKHRNSVVVLYTPGHYSLVVIKDDNDYLSLFEPDHSFIKKIRERMKLKGVTMII